MSDKTSIEWTATVNADGTITKGATWNPIRGCTKISPGCAHCYAETFAERFRGVKGHPYEQGFDLRLVPEKLTEPLSWKKPRRVFVNSMSDLFQDGVPDEYIDRMFAVMALAGKHTFQVLTKRPERMRTYLSGLGRSFPRLQAACPEGWSLKWSEIPLIGWPLPNVWLGVSVENQHFADERIPLLLQTPAAVRFISAEPLLGPVNLHNYLFTVGTARLNHLHWVIDGGESGPGARPSHPEWFRRLRDQCVAAGVGYFHNQNGEWVDYMQIGAAGWDRDDNRGDLTYGHLFDAREQPLFDGRQFETRYPWHTNGHPGPCMVRVGKKAAGRLLDGREWNDFPEPRA